MNFVEFFKNTFVGIFRDKRKFFYVIVLLFCSLISFSILTFKKNFDMYIAESITKILDFVRLVYLPNKIKKI